MVICFFANGMYSEEDIPVSICEKIVAVDGGANFLRKKSIVPHLFVGDADSVTPQTMEWLKENNVEIKLFPEEKDEIDLELALMMFPEEEKIVYGWQGDRYDMFLALLHLLKRFKNTTLWSSNLLVGYVEGEKVLAAEPGEKWSILPLGGDAEGVTLEGFKYTLKDALMPIDKPFGVSNVALERVVKIKVEKGGVVYFRWKREPL